MSYTAYAEIGFVGLLDTAPADWRNFGANPPTLSIGTVATSISRYGLEPDGRGTLHAAEFGIQSVILSQPADYGSQLTFPTYLGTDHVPRWRIVLLPDGFVIPPEYGGGGAFGQVGPGNMFNYTDADHTGFSLADVRYTSSTHVAGSVTFGNLTLSTRDTVYTIADNAASAAGLTGLSTAIRNVASARNALENVMTNGMTLLDYGINHTGGSAALGHSTFDRMAQQYMISSGNAFNVPLSRKRSIPAIQQRRILLMESFAVFEWSEPFVRMGSSRLAPAFYFP
jgi:hypothetical protein